MTDPAADLLVRDPRVPPIEADSLTAGRRIAGAVALELECVDSGDADRDRLWRTGLDADRPERAPIAEEHHGRPESRGRSRRQPEGHLEPASAVRERIFRERCRVADAAVERETLGVDRSGDLHRTRVHLLAQVPGRL